MEDGSPKNMLQEYYQKKSLPLPSYKTRRVGGQDHMSVWSSVVTIEHGNMFEGVNCGSKKEAELSAASFALQYLDKKKKTKKKVDHTTKPSVHWNNGDTGKFFQQLSNRSQLNVRNRERFDIKCKPSTDGQRECLPAFSQSIDYEKNESTDSNSPTYAEEPYSGDELVPLNYFFTKSSLQKNNLTVPSIKRDVNSGSLHIGSKETDNVDGCTSQSNPTSPIRPSVPTINLQSSNNVQRKTKPTKDPNIYVFIDVENQPVIAKNILQLLFDGKVLSNIIVNFVMSECFSNRFKFQEEISSLNSKNVSYYTVVGDAGYLKNSADMAITIMASRVDDSCDVLIVTADRFAHLFGMVCNFIDKKKRIFHITNERDVVERIC
jgi:double-stranded RNA binding protein